MTLLELKKAIREEVRAAIRQELQELLIEAVRAASTSDNLGSLQESTPAQKADIRKSFIEHQEYKPYVSTEKGVVNPIEGIMAETRASMTNEDYRNIAVMDSSMVSSGVPNIASRKAAQMGLTGSEPGVDISQLGFLKKATALSNVMDEKDELKKI